MNSVPLWVAPLLWCPDCSSGALREETAGLRCEACHRRYETRGVPVLIPDTAGPLEVRHDRPLQGSEALLDQIERRGWIGDEIVASLPQASVVLSVGEGFGEMMVRLGRRHPDRYFVGTDLSRDRIARAIALRDRYGLENVWFCVADAQKLPFARGAFEFGYARGILHILPQPDRAVDELRRVLRFRLLVDALANRPFFELWFWLLQRYENVRARLQRRPAEPGIWEGVVETLQHGTYQPLWWYRRWFSMDRSIRLRATSLFIWETGKHHPLIGWLGTEGAIDVHL